jgi:hypothetical protein
MTCQSHPLPQLQLRRLLTLHLAQIAHHQLPILQRGAREVDCAGPSDATHGRPSLAGASSPFAGLGPCLYDAARPPQCHGVYSLTYMVDGLCTSSSSKELLAQPSMATDASMHLHCTTSPHRPRWLHSPHSAHALAHFHFHVHVHSQCLPSRYFVVCLGLPRPAS